MTIKAILYDHDGTLVDSETRHFEIWHDVLSTFECDLNRDTYKRFHAGLPTLANAQDMVQRFTLSLSATELARLKDQATQTFLSQDKYPLMPGVLDSLQFFDDLGLSLAVVTGAGRSDVNTSISLHAIQSRFDQVISADDVDRGKPAPDCYLLAARKLGVSPSQCVAIEDTAHGAEAAFAADIPCVVVPNSMSDDAHFPNATKVCDNIMQASHWIKKQYLR